MIITCEKCGTQFAVNSKAIPPEGRKVKCSKCAHVWNQKPLEQISEKAKDVTPPPKKVEDIPEGSNLPAVHEDLNEKDTSSTLGRKLAFVTLLCFTLTTGILIYRESLAHKIPALKKIEILKTSDGLVFDRLSIKRKRVENKVALSIDGLIRNKTPHTITIPQITISILSRGGRMINQQTFRMPEESLQPERSIAFTPVLEGLSGNVDRVVVDMGNRWEMMFRD